MGEQGQLDWQPGMALLVIDLQHDFLRSDGRMPVDQGQVTPMLETANAVIAAACAADCPVYQVVNAFGRWSIANPFRRFAAIEGSAGAAIDDRVASGAWAVFTKRRGDCFSNPGLAEALEAEKIGHVVLVGVYANGCVAATARGARRRGLEVTVLAEGVAAGSIAARRRGLRACARLGARIVPPQAALPAD